jgi:hypothetical protein
MAAPSGNQYWKLRDKHGRDKVFSSPEEMAHAFEEYIEFTKNRTDFNKVRVKKNVIKPQNEDCDLLSQDEIEVITKTVGVEEHTVEESPVPLSVGGFCLHVGASSAFLKNFVLRINDEKEGLDPNDDKEKVEEIEDFLAVIEVIKEVCLYDQLNGAMTGAYKENIVARINNITDGLDNNIVTKNKRVRRFFDPEGQEMGDFE